MNILRKIIFQAGQFKAKRRVCCVLFPPFRLCLRIRRGRRKETGELPCISVALAGLREITQVSPSSWYITSSKRLFASLSLWKIYTCVWQYDSFYWNVLILYAHVWNYNLWVCVLKRVDLCTKMCGNCITWQDVRTNTSGSANSNVWICVVSCVIFVINRVDVRVNMCGLVY